MGKRVISTDHLLGIRCFSIIGIIFSHTYTPYVYETGNFWRIPVLFLVGGASVIAYRPISSTVKYVFNGFYLYVVAWSLIYLTVLYFIFSGQAPNKFIYSYNLTSTFASDIFIHNNHKNGIILGSWFLIPYALSLIALAATHSIFRQYAIIQLPIAIVLLIISFYLIVPDKMHWTQRIIAQTCLASGLMLLGKLLFTNSTLFKYLQNGWVIVITFGVALLFSQGFGNQHLIWSWMTSKTHYWLMLPTFFLFVPIIFWIGKQVSAYPDARYIGSKSKHIMMHHLFGIFLVNLTLVKLGYVPLEAISPLFVYNGPILWPIYLIAGLG